MSARPLCCGNAPPADHPPHAGGNCRATRGVGHVIVTVTLNPALRVRYQAGQVRLGARNQVSEVSYRAGGRGLAVARVLHTFGHEVVAAGLAGGASGEMIRAELAKAGVPAHFTWISGESRRVLDVADESAGAVTGFGEPAPYITTEELGRLAADYRSLMSDASAAVLCGSLPAGLPPEIYGSLASYAAEAGVPVILDADGSALWHAVRRRPALVVPEQAPDPGQLVASGAGAVAVLCDHLVRVVTAGQEWRARLTGPPGGGPGLPGSRAALVAGLVPGITLGWSWPDMLRHAVALAATAGAAGDVDLESYESLVPEVTVEPPG
jgi:tagatose 6-phosphate kinase